VTLVRIVFISFPNVTGGKAREDRPLQAQPLGTGSSSADQSTCVVGLSCTALMFRHDGKLTVYPAPLIWPKPAIDGPGCILNLSLLKECVEPLTD